MFHTASHRFGSPDAFSQATFHFVDGDDCVVDQQTKRDNQTGHRHLVNRNSPQLHSKQCHQTGQRQRQRHDDRGSPPHQEKNNDGNRSGTQHEIAGQFTHSRGNVIVLNH